MTNTKAFYKLTSKRQEIEDFIEPYDAAIQELKDAAKKLKKGSPERQELMKKANDLKNEECYKKWQTELRIMNYCINTVFYL